MKNRSASPRGTIVAGVLVVVATFVVTFNMFAGHYYVQGGYYFDSGWFAWLASHSSPTSMPNAPGIGGDYYEIHVSPIFVLMTAMSKTILAPLSEALRFSVVQALWSSLIALGVFLSVSRRVGPIAGAAVSVGAAFSGLVLAVTAFPHHEIAIPALLILAFGLFVRDTRRSRYLGYAAIVLGLTVREDAGLHYFGIFFAVGLAFWIWRDTYEESWMDRIPFFRVACACALSSIATIVLQTVLFKQSGETSSFQRVFTGSPAYAHVSVDLLRDRGTDIVMSKPFIWSPFVIIGAWLIAKREWLALTGLTTGLPWALFCFVAASDLTGVLDTYYVFPLIVPLTWPLFSPLRQTPSTQQGVIYLCGLVFALSAALTTIPEALQIKSNPIRDADFDYLQRVGPTDNAIDVLSANRAVGGAILVDDAIASLMTADAPGLTWIGSLSDTKADLAQVETIVLMRGSWLEYHIWVLAEEAGFRHWYRFPDSEVLVVTRAERADLVAAWGLVQA